MAHAPLPEEGQGRVLSVRLSRLRGTLTRRARPRSVGCVHASTGLTAAAKARPISIRSLQPTARSPQPAARRRENLSPSSQRMSTAEHGCVCQAAQGPRRRLAGTLSGSRTESRRGAEGTLTISPTLDKSPAMLNALRALPFWLHFSTTLHDLNGCLWVHSFGQSACAQSTCVDGLGGPTAQSAVEFADGRSCPRPTRTRGIELTKFCGDGTDDSAKNAAVATVSFLPFFPAASSRPAGKPARPFAMD